MYEGSTVTLSYHFSWPDKISATNILVNVNGNYYPTDANGWISMRLSNDKLDQLRLLPLVARWGPFELTITYSTSVLKIIFDRVLIALLVPRSSVEHGLNTFRVRVESSF